MKRYTFREVSQMLGKNSEAVARHILPSGNWRRHGKELCIGDIYGNAGDSLKLCVTGSKSGIWCDFAGGNEEKGDLLKFWALAKNLSQYEAFLEALEYLGIKNHCHSQQASAEKFDRPVKKHNEVSYTSLVGKYLVKERKLTMGTLIQFKIGEQSNQILFPSYKSGELIRTKSLSLERDENGKKKIFVSPNSKAILFGWQAAHLQAKAVILTEGEIDAMSLHQYEIKRFNPELGVEEPVAVLSIPLGAGLGKKQEWAQNEKEVLLAYDEIYICMDNDNEGQNTISELAKTLEKDSYRIIKLPYKDANACLQKGITKQEIQNCFDNAIFCVVKEQKILPFGILESLITKELALDGIKYAWGNNLSLQADNFPKVIVKVNEKEVLLDWFNLAASLSSEEINLHSFTDKAKVYLYSRQNSKDRDNRISKEAADTATQIISDFFKYIIEYQPSEENGEIVLQKILEVESRYALLEQVKNDVTNPQKLMPDIIISTSLQLNKLATIQKQDLPFGIEKESTFFDMFSKKSFIQTPFNQLNNLLCGGFHKGNLYVLLATPKSGKTTLASIIMDFAAANGHPVLYMGYEMGKTKMILYAISRKTGINSAKIESQNLNADEQNKVIDAYLNYCDVEGKHLTIIEAAEHSFSYINSWLMRNKSSEKIPLVVVDYLQIAKSGVKSIDESTSATERVGQLAVMCKQIARSKGAVMFALSSVTKTAELDSNNKGKMDVTAARDSLAIIHAADGVFSLQSSLIVNKDKSLLDAWEVLRDNLPEKEQGLTITSNIAKNENKYPKSGNNYGTRSVLYLDRHRGVPGNIPLYYTKATHSFEEVQLCGVQDSPSFDTINDHFLEKARKAFSENLITNNNDRETIII